MSSTGGQVLSREERDFKIVWDNIFRVSYLPTKALLALTNKSAYTQPWSHIDYVDVYISRYGTKELPNIASLLERHNARIKTLSLKVCEKYSTPALEDVAKAMVARVGPSIETLEITFRLTGAPRSWAEENPAPLISNFLRNQKIPNLKTLAVCIPEDFNDWSLFKDLTSVKSLTLHVKGATLNSQSLKIENERDLEALISATSAYFPPKVGANFKIYYFNMRESDYSGQIKGSPMQTALKCGLSLSYLKSLESRGVDMSDADLCHSLIGSAAELGRQDVVEWVIQIGGVNLLNDGGELLRRILLKGADNCFEAVFKHQFASELEHGYLANLFYEQEDFYTDDVFCVVTDARLEWILQHQEKLGIDFVNNRPVTPFEKLSNVLGHAMFNSLNRWDKVPSTVKMILKYNDAVKLFTPPEIDPTLPEQVIQHNQYGDILPSDDRRPESPLKTWAMSHMDICVMISEGPTEPWETAQSKFLQFMFEKYLEQILTVDRSALEFHREVLEKGDRHDLLERMNKFVAENPLPGQK